MRFVSLLTAANKPAFQTGHEKHTIVFNRRGLVLHLKQAAPGTSVHVSVRCLICRPILPAHLNSLKQMMNRRIDYSFVPSAN